MAAWASNAAVAAPAPARKAGPATRSRTRPKAQPRKRALLGGVVWIVGLAALLGGIVALNVAVLQLNLQLDRQAGRQAELRARNDVLSAQLSRAVSAPQVAAVANRRLGLVPAPADEIAYVELGEK